MVDSVESLFPVIQSQKYERILYQQIRGAAGGIPGGTTRRKTMGKYTFHDD